MLGILSAILLASTSALPQGLETELASRYAKWDKAYLSGDTKLLESLLHANFRLVTVAGKVRTRAEYVRGLADFKPPMRYKTTLLKADGNRSAASAWTEESSQRRGQEEKIHRYLDKWAKSGGHWLLLESRTLSEETAVGGWTELFDGKTLDGWFVSSRTGHGTGGRWVVEAGAIVGSQDVPGNGGILITHETFGDFEVELEMRNDFGPDSGLFLRSNDKGQAYQAMIDYRRDGNLMGIYGEGIGGFHHRNFTFADSPETITAVASPLFPLPVSPEKWPSFWKHLQWMKLRARITGNPPTIETWIEGVQFMKFADTQKRLPDSGGIGLQVHGGGDLTKQYVRYRNIRVRKISG